MRLIPNSAGSRRLREYNKCHEPAGSAKGGQFARANAGNCQPDRTVYGASTDDPLDPDLQFSMQSAQDLWEKADAFGGHPSSNTAKDKVASALAEALMVIPADRLYAFRQERNFPARYATDLRTSDLAPDPDSQQAKDSYASYLTDRRQAQALYDAIEGEENGPEPDSVRDDYDEYYNELEEQAYDSAREDWWSNQLPEDYKNEMEREYEDVINDAWEDAGAAYELARARASTYGNTDTMYALFDHDPVGGKVGHYTAEEILIQWRDHGENAPFLHNPTFLIDGKNPFEHDPVDWTNLADVEDIVTIFDGPDWDKYSSDAEFDGDGVQVDALDFGSWYREKYGIDPEDWDGKPPFQRWYRETYGEEYGSAEKSFEDWYVNRFGVDLDATRSSGDIRQMKHRQLASDVASGLVHTWAETSSDNHPLAVALQLHAKERFNLGTTYEREELDEHNLHGRATSIRTRHGAILSAFLDGMYTRTQEMFATMGYGPEDRVTLYRGMEFGSRKDRAQVKNLNSGGELVDVLLQPLSSFSTSLNTASSFGTAVLAVHVPVKQIVASPFSGVGCLSEREFTIKGGRYTAVVTTNGALRRFESRSIAERMADAIATALRRGTKPRRGDPLPGERL